MDNKYLKESAVLLQNLYTHMIDEFCDQIVEKHPRHLHFVVELKKRWVANMATAEKAARLVPPKILTGAPIRPPSSALVVPTVVPIKVPPMNEMKVMADQIYAEMMQKEKEKKLKENKVNLPESEAVTESPTPESPPPESSPESPSLSPTGSEYDVTDIDDPYKLFVSDNFLVGQHTKVVFSKRGFKLNLKSAILVLGDKNFGFSDVEINAPF